MTTASGVLKTIFSIYGLKIIIMFLTLTVIYNYLITYFKLKLGIIDLNGSYDFKIFKISKTLIFGLTLTAIGILFYNLLPFEKILSNIFSMLNISHDQKLIINNENFYEI